MSTHLPFTASPHLLPGGDLLTPLVEAADAAAIAAMLVVLEPWRALGYRPDTLTRYLLRADPALHRFRILHGDGPAGVLCVRYPWLRGPYIELIGLWPEVRGKGLGGVVLDWIEVQARGEGSNLWACVSESNTAGRRFYERRGFIQVAPIDDLVTHGHAEILVRKRISG
ncbi:MAG: GNAT family N-acetyltransferase [Rhodospirillales bacterium]